MKIYEGIVASPGISTGEIVNYKISNILDNITECYTDNVNSEVIKLDNSLNNFKKYINELRSLLPKETEELLGAHELMAETIIEDAKKYVREKGVCATFAIKVIFEKYYKLIKESGSEVISLRAEDLKSIATSLVEILLNTTVEEGGQSFANKIILANELMPIDFYRIISRGTPSGIITFTGGVTSHVAILAKTYGIPYLILKNEEFNENFNGRIAILDAIDGKLILEPTNEVLNEYNSKIITYRKFKEVLRDFSYRVGVTRDNYRVNVLCNIGNVEESQLASSLGCEGVGLFRIEYLYISSLPTEDALYSVFSKVSMIFENKPVVIRAPDLGADKPLPYLKFNKEENPFLGMRGIRFLLEYRNEIFIPFLRSFLKALDKGRNLKLLLPMISTTSEVREVMDLINELSSKLNIRSNVDVGIMVETPASALMVDKIAEIENIRFLSFGTNDLTQYTLAVDRNNAKVNYLYNDLDPAVIRLMAIATNAAKSKGLEVEICGELASKQLAIPVLLALGINSLSVNLSSVGLIKYTLSMIKKSEADILRDKILNFSTHKELREFLIQYLKDNNVELLYV